MKNLLLLFFLLPVFVGAQNLVPNPSFEDTINCPWTLSQIYLANGWNININTSDYFNACASSPDVSVPLNAWGFQNANSGTAYAGFCAFHPTTNYREYLGRQLLSPLIVGEEYFISFKISLSDAFNCGVNNIGLLFTNEFLGDTAGIIPSPFLNNSASIHSTSIIIDTLNWTNISGSFIADSSYQYFMIGNFYDDSHTSIYCIDTNNFTNQISYYFVDDICISSDSLECDLSPEGIYHPNKSEVSIYPNPAGEKIFLSFPTQTFLSGEIINSIGQLIKSFQGREIDVSKLPDGIYILKITFNNKIIYKKQIIQH